MTLLAADQVTLSIDEQGVVLPVAALRRHELSLTRSLSDMTIAAGSGWREASPLERPIAAELRASGVFVSGQASTALRQAMLSAEAKSFELSVPGDGTWQGLFLITTLTVSGRSEEEEMFTLRLSSTGPITFTAST